MCPSKNAKKNQRKIYTLVICVCDFNKVPIISYIPSNQEKTHLDTLVFSKQIIRLAGPWPAVERNKIEAVLFFPCFAGPWPAILALKKRRSSETASAAQKPHHIP